MKTKSKREIIRDSNYQVVIAEVNESLPIRVLIHILGKHTPAVLDADEARKLATFIVTAIPARDVIDQMTDARLKIKRKKKR